MKDILIYLLRRDSINASVVAINIAQDMSPSDLRSIADYFLGLAADKDSRIEDITANYF